MTPFCNSRVVVSPSRGAKKPLCRSLEPGGFVRQRLKAIEATALERHPAICTNHKPPKIGVSSIIPRTPAYFYRPVQLFPIIFFTDQTENDAHSRYPVTVYIQSAGVASAETSTLKKGAFCTPRSSPTAATHDHQYMTSRSRRLPSTACHERQGLWRRHGRFSPQSRAQPGQPRPELHARAGGGRDPHP